MSTYVPSLNLLFIHSPYTASRAVSGYLQEQHQGRRISTKMHMGVAESLEVLGGTSKQPKAEIEDNVEVIKGGVALFQYEIEEAPMPFTVIRNPYDIMVTMYLKRCPDKDFEYFLREVYPIQEEISPDFRMHVELLKGVIWLLHYENLIEELQSLFKFLTVRANIQLPLIGRTPQKRDYTSYYNGTTARLTYEYAREYFELTGYPAELYGREATVGCVALDCKSRPKG